MTEQISQFASLGPGYAYTNAVIPGDLTNYRSPLAVTPQQFGAKGDGVTDDSAAFVAAIAFLKSIAGNPVNNYYMASPKLFVPAGHYYLGTITLDITHTLIIEGDGGQGFGFAAPHSAGGAATKLRWAPGTTGIRIQAYDTNGASGIDASPYHSSGSETTLRQLHLVGGFDPSNPTSTPEGEFHAIHTKEKIFLDSVKCELWQGDGLYAHTVSGGGAPNEGNSNASRAYNCYFGICRNGVSLLGADANVWTFISCQALYNRACGFDDQSFLGNTYVGCHTAGNGVSGNNDGSSGFPAYVVSQSGNHYAAIQGQEAGASTNAPSGTTSDNSWWYYLRSGAPAAGTPAWTSGIHVRCGAPYRSNNNNGQNVYINCYEESDQGFSQHVHPTLILAGLKGPGNPKGDAAYIRANNGATAVDNLTVFGNMGVAGEIGFFGHSLAAQHTATPANATDLASAITLVNDLKTALLGYGLVA